MPHLKKGISEHERLYCAMSSLSLHALHGSGATGRECSTSASLAALCMRMKACCMSVVRMLHLKEGRSEHERL